MLLWARHTGTEVSQVRQEQVWGGCVQNADLPRSFPMKPAPNITHHRYTSMFSTGLSLGKLHFVSGARGVRPLSGRCFRALRDEMFPPTLARRLQSKAAELSSLCTSHGTRPLGGKQGITNVVLRDGSRDLISSPWRCLWTLIPALL